MMPDGYEDMAYVEPCGGAASVLLNKLRSKVEIYNDIDASLYNLFYCLKEHPDEMISLVQNIDYTEDVWKMACLGPKDGVTGAVNELVARRMSRGGLKDAFSWSKRKRGGRPGDENAWITFKAALPQICERLTGVEIMNRHVVDVINEYDAEDVLFYVDPPYLPSTRTARGVYDHEMGEADHVLLSQVLLEAKGKVILSGYYSHLYAKLYKDWNMEVREMPNHASQSKKKQRRLECFWTNY